MMELICAWLGQFDYYLVADTDLGDLNPRLSNYSRALVTEAPSDFRFLRALEVVTR